jgi:hypothetical protein
MGAGNDGGNPREESFCKFLKNFCCPMFLFKSVIFFVSIVDIVMYIISIAYGIKKDAKELLAPEIATLDWLGMKVSIILKNNLSILIKCNKDKCGDS